MDPQRLIAHGRNCQSRKLQNLKEITVFSDGGCIGNPGPGGYAAIVLADGVYREFAGGEPNTTNNRMEMRAAIVGLKNAPGRAPVRMVTDSRYLTDGASKWLKGWKARGWKKADGGEVLNRDLWEEIDSLMASRKVTWEHVAGHSGHPENERCDRIANGYARGEPPDLRQGDGSWIHGESGARGEAEGGVRYDKPLYLSIVGGHIEEHGTWPACEARIKGVKGARCKKVSSKSEHLAALMAWKDLE